MTNTLFHSILHSIDKCCGEFVHLVINVNAQLSVLVNTLLHKNSQTQKLFALHMKELNINSYETQT